MQKTRAYLKALHPGMMEAADAVLTMMAIGDYVTETLDQELEELQNLLEEARKGLKA